MEKAYNDIYIITWLIVDTITCLFFTNYFVRYFASRLIVVAAARAEQLMALCKRVTMGTVGNKLETLLGTC